jgi:hypothetical protein
VISMKFTGFLLGLLRTVFLLLTSWGSPALWAQCENQNAVPHTDVSTADPTQSHGSSTSESKKKSERIFGVVPTYTITDARSAPPLTPKQKFGLFVKGTLDPFPAMVYLVQAGFSQARDTHSGYGQGAAGYGKRFGAALADGTSARFFSTYALPSLLHQDPRYFRKGEGSAWSRVGYSISRGFVTRADSGRPQANWSNILGKFAGAGLSNLYYPEADRGGELTLSRVAISLGYQTLGNLAIEFWPEIHRKFFGGNKRGSSGQEADAIMQSIDPGVPQGRTVDGS